MIHVLSICSSAHANAKQQVQRLHDPAIQLRMYSFTMVGNGSSVLLLNDVSLPIIISDFDASDNDKQPMSAGVAGRIDREDSVSTTHTTSSSASLPRWTTGFGNYVDDMFGRMTNGMKRKLREACFEVLRRTDETGREEFVSPFEDDARFLD